MPLLELYYRGALSGYYSCTIPLLVLYHHFARAVPSTYRKNFALVSSTVIYLVTTLKNGEYIHPAIELNIRR